MALTGNKDNGGGAIEFVDVEGSHVRFMRTGYGPLTGPPLLLINGMGARLEMWQPLSSVMSDRSFLRFDLPGITGRPAHDLPLEMAGLARWLGRLLDALDIEKVDVLGYSWGGVLAQQFAHDSSERVRALVLASTNFGFGALYEPELAPFFNLLPSDGGDDPWKLLTAAFGGDLGSRNPIDALVSAFKPSTSPFEGYQRQFLSLTGWTSVHWLHELTMSTLVVAGDNDPYVPSSMTRKLAQAIRCVRL